MLDITENACTACEGLGEVDCQGNYYDFEPPTKKCTECNGTGDGEIQEWQRSLWVDACRRAVAKGAL